MTLERILAECVLFGSVFTQAEVLFNSFLVYEYQFSKKTREISFPFPNNKKDPIRGHSYPIMGVLGALSVPALHYIPLLENPASTIVCFGIGIATVEYACGKLNYVPWKEVYTYLETRVKHSIPQIKKIHLTCGNDAVFIPLIPVWSVLGLAISYLHNMIHK